MAARALIPEKKIAAALRKHAGIMSLAAEELETTRQNVYGRIRDSKKLQAVMIQIEESVLDMGEGNVMEGLRAKSERLTTWYLERKGKKRGYGNQVQNSFDETQLEALIASLGGDASKFRDALVRLGADPDQA